MFRSSLRQQVDGSVKCDPDKSQPDGRGLHVDAGNSPPLQTAVAIILPLCMSLRDAGRLAALHGPASILPRLAAGIAPLALRAPPQGTQETSKGNPT